MAQRLGKVEMGRMVRRVRYGVAMSLDGFIAGPKGEADWIVMDPEIDFDAMTRQFDTLLMGRKTFEWMQKAGGGMTMPGMEVLVFSRTLRPEDHPGVKIVADAEKAVAEVKDRPGKDVWLFGGGSLFRSLAEMGLVDAVEVAVVPVILGEGVPLAGSGGKRIRLRLTGQKVYEKTGTVSLEYAVEREGRGMRMKDKG